MADWLLYEHDDGRHAVAPNAEAATFAHGDPTWHRVGPVEVPDGMATALKIVQAEIARAEALLAVEDGGRPVFDRPQTEAGIAALRTVAAAIERDRNAGVPASSTGLTLDANDTRFLAARLRRLFEHFGVPVPGADDNARLIGSAGAAIGLLLTRHETAEPAAWVNGDELRGKANATIACGAERRWVNGHAYDTPLYTRGVAAVDGKTKTGETP